MAMSILPKFLTLKWNISRTIWRIEVGDGSFFSIFQNEEVAVYSERQRSFHLFFSVCFKDFSCSHQSFSDAERHIQCKGHQQAVTHAVGETQGSVSTFMVPEPLEDNFS